MSRDPSAIKGAFLSDDVWFIADRTLTFLPNAARAEPVDIMQDLQGLSGLPDLDGAPVASWLLARVMRLTAGRSPYDYDQVQGSDGHDFIVHFLCVNGDGDPVGDTSIIADASRIRLFASALPPESPSRLADLIFAGVTREPHKVARCRLTIQYTDSLDPEAMFSIPRVYGWDGNRYLNEMAPEHAIDWSEYE